MTPVVFLVLRRELARLRLSGGEVIDDVFHLRHFKYTALQNNWPVIRGRRYVKLQPEA